MTMMMIIENVFRLTATVYFYCACARRATLLLSAHLHQSRQFSCLVYDRDIPCELHRQFSLPVSKYVSKSIYKAQ